jgi:hypothetical protein
MAYVQAVNTGDGFITHADQPTLAFSGQVDNYWLVTGNNIEPLVNEANIAAWATRVGGTVVDDVTALADIAAWMAYIYEFQEFWFAKLSANAATTLLQLAFSDAAVKDILALWLSDTLDLRNQDYIDGVVYLLTEGHIQQAAHDSLRLNKDGVSV